MFVQKNGYFYYKECEDLSIDFERGWLIVSELKNNSNINNLEKIGNISKNMSMYDCTYPKEVENKIKELKEKSIIKDAKFLH